MREKLRNYACAFAAIALFAYAAITQAQGVASVSNKNKLPDYFFGSFEDTVPNLFGGSIPDTKFTATCDQASGCLITIGQGEGERFGKLATVGNLQAARYALSYARQHKDVPPNSAYAWPAQNLRPLLASNAEIETCINLGTDSLPDGYILMCKLDQDPWGKTTILPMGTLMSGCAQLFCRYEIYPPFRKNP